MTFTTPLDDMIDGYVVQDDRRPDHNLGETFPNYTPLPLFITTDEDY